MDKIILTRMCEHFNDGVVSTCSFACPTAANPDCTITRPMISTEQQRHYRHIIARANQSVTARNGFADNSIFFKTVVQEAHTFTDKDGVEWQVALIQ